MWICKLFCRSKKFHGRVAEFFHPLHLGETVDINGQDFRVKEILHTLDSSQNGPNDFRQGTLPIVTLEATEE